MNSSADIAAATEDNLTFLGACHAELPLAQVRDEYRYDLFCPIVVAPPGSAPPIFVPLVLPRTTLFPSVMEYLAQQFPGTDPIDLAGGIGISDLVAPGQAQSEEQTPGSEPKRDDEAPRPPATEAPGSLDTEATQGRTTRTSRFFTWLANVAEPENGPDDTIASASLHYSLHSVGQLAGFGVSPNVPPGAPMTVPIAMWLPYRQRWLLKGYSAGDLVGQVSLLPGETQLIEVFTWDRTRREEEDAATSEQERSFENSTTTKESLEAVQETTRTLDSKQEFSGSVKLPVDVLPLSFGATRQDAQRIADVEQTNRARVDDALRRSAQRISATRQVRVTETHESGSEHRTTRQLTNPNMCHTLTVDCFAVNAHYDVATSLQRDRCRLCALVSLPDVGRPFDRSFVLTWEGALRGALLYPKTYASGMDAVRNLEVAAHYCALHCYPQCACTPAATPAASGVPASVLDPLRHNLAHAAMQFRSAVKSVADADPSGCCSELNRGLSAVTDDNVDQLRRWVLRRSCFEGTVHHAVGAKVAGFWGASEAFLAAEASGTDDDITKSFNAPDAVAAFLNSLDADAPQALSAEVHGWAQGSYLIPPNLAGWNDLPPELQRSSGLQRGNATVALLASNRGRSILNVDDPLTGPLNVLIAARNAYDTAARSGGGTPTPAPTVPPGAPAGASSSPPPPTADQDADIRQLATDEVQAESLLRHLTANEGYYREMIWRSLSPDDKLQYLSQLGNLLLYVEPEVVGFCGRLAALPIRTSMVPGLKEWLESHLPTDEEAHLPADGEAAGDHKHAVSVVLPKPAVEMRPRLSRCDTCEPFISKHRRWDVRESRARVKMLEAEARRYALRLEEKPPLLDDPSPHDGASSVRVELQSSDPGN